MKFHSPILSLLIVAKVLPGIFADDSDDDCLNMEVNYAFGGAKTDFGNRALDCFGGLLGDCNEKAAQTQTLEAAGLSFPGLVQEVDWAQLSLTDVDPEEDLFLLYAAGNDFYGPYQGWNPAVPTPGYGEEIPDGFHPSDYWYQFTARWSVENLEIALNRIYSEVGARYIIMGNWLEPCSTPTCDKLSYLDTVIPNFTFGLKLYSALWVEQFDQGIRTVVNNFNTNHNDVTVIFVDVWSKITELLTNGNFDTSTTCLDAYLQDGPSVPGPDENGFYDCGNKAWFDDLHPTSEMWDRIVQEAFLPAIQVAIAGSNGGDSDSDDDVEFRRLISFGDSYSDLGSQWETICRTNDADWCADFRPPPTNGKAAQNAKSLVTFIEDGLGIRNSKMYIQKNPNPNDPCSVSDSDDED